MARYTWSVHLLLVLLVTSCLCTLLFTSAKEISSNGIRRVSAAEWEKALNDHPELSEYVQVADNGELHPYVHSRNRRTIGRVFDMFRGLFDRIFGGKKGGGGGGGYGAPQKQQAASYGPPKQKNPSAGYGPPRDPKPNYGTPQKQQAASYGPPINPNPGYGAPGPRPRPPAPGPLPARPQPPRPRPPGPPRQRPRRPQAPRPQAPIQPGYGGPRPARPAPGGYGRPQGPSQPNYGGQTDLPQAPVIGGGDPDGYGSPQAPIIGGEDIDGYGSPQAPVVGGGDIDGYGAPQAPVVVGGDLDGYGSPQAPAIGGGDIDGYGSPQAPAIGGGNANLGQYGSPPRPIGGGGQPIYGGAPQPFRAAPQPNFGTPGPSIQLSVGVPFPAAPIRNSGLPTSASLADSVFRMIPAPNLATGRPPTAGRNNVQGNTDSYGSPQSQVIGGGVLKQATDSYGSPQGPTVISAGAGNSYGSPIAPTASANPFIKSSAPPLSIYTSQATLLSQPTGDIIVGNGKAQAPSSGADIITSGGGTVAIGGTYGSPTLPIITDQQQGSLPLPNSNPDSYGSPEGPSVGPITDIDLPSVIPEAVVPGVEPRVQPVETQGDVFGSPLAPVGTSAPVPQDIIKQIENNLDSFDTSPIANEIAVSQNDDVPEGELVSATEEEDEYDEIEKEVIDDLVDQIKNELGDPTTIKDPEEEKFLQEVINTIEYIENDPNNDAGVSSEGSRGVLSSSTGGDGQDSYGGSNDVDNRGNAVDDEPLFDNVRDKVVDPPATGTPGPTFDLSGGFVDLSNGVLSQGSEYGQSTQGEINLTGTTTPGALVDYEATSQAPEESEYEETYDDTVDQTVSATTAQPQYDVNDEYDEGYDNADESYSDSQEYVDKDGDVDVATSGDYGEDSDEGEQGYDIRVPENPLDSNLSGVSEYDDVSGSGNEYSDIGEEYETGDYDDNSEREEEPEITTSRPSLISIPLLIEEKDGDVQANGNRGGDPTVILAGTDEERKPDTLYGGPLDGYEDEADLRRARQTNANSPAHSQGVRIRPPKEFQYLDSPQTKRQVKAKDLPVTRLHSGRGGQDWSQRLRERQRQRIWRQFNLDRRQGRVYFSQHNLGA